MPITDDALQKEKNRFIAVTGDAKFGQLIAALNAVGGQPWWHAVVKLSDGSWGAARISKIGESLAATDDAAETRISDVGGMQTIVAVERNTLETKEAQALAKKSAGGVLLVTENGAPVGIMVEGFRRGGGSSSGGLALSSTSLDQLGGKYVKLKDYGSILLSSSKK
jgi:hypothetical protein